MAFGSRNRSAPSASLVSRERTSAYPLVCGLQCIFIITHKRNSIKYLCSSLSDVLVFIDEALLIDFMTNIRELNKPMRESSHRYIIVYKGLQYKLGTHIVLSVIIVLVGSHSAQSPHAHCLAAPNPKRASQRLSIHDPRIGPITQTCTNQIRVIRPIRG